MRIYLESRVGRASRFQFAFTAQQAGRNKPRAGSNIDNSRKPHAGVWLASPCIGYHTDAFLLGPSMRDRCPISDTSSSQTSTTTYPTGSMCKDGFHGNDSTYGPSTGLLSKYNCHVTIKSSHRMPMTGHLCSSALFYKHVPTSLHRITGHSQQSKQQGKTTVRGSIDRQLPQTW